MRNDDATVARQMNIQLDIGRAGVARSSEGVKGIFGIIAARATMSDDARARRIEKFGDDFRPHRRGESYPVSG